MLTLPSNRWKDFLKEELNTTYGQSLVSTLTKDYESIEVLPKEELIFNAYSHTAPERTLVVIVGQDPYPNPSFAMGLSFSVPSNEPKVPQSLKNIYKELESSVPGFKNPGHGDLTGWTEQGVLLLNSSLTFSPKSDHTKIGWQALTDNTIRFLSKNYEHIVFMLWGNHGKSKASLIDARKHCILQSAHPSPFSARKGFFGNNHFSDANAYLAQHGRPTINWSAL